mgnify:CR=1 FL=1
MALFLEPTIYQERKETLYRFNDSELTAIGLLQDLGMKRKDSEMLVFLNSSREWFKIALIAKKLGHNRMDSYRSTRRLVKMKLVQSEVRRLDIGSRGWRRKKKYLEGLCLKASENIEDILKDRLKTSYERKLREINELRVCLNNGGAKDVP